MVTVAREIEISTAAATGVEDAVAAGIMRAGAKLGAARFARISQTHIDVPSGPPTSHNKMRLLVTFVLDD
jgi:flavin-binding protein dodecin